MRALATSEPKIQRGHGKDLADARGLAEQKLIERARLAELFDSIEPSLYRYPAIDAAGFRRAVDEFVTGLEALPVLS